MTFDIITTALLPFFIIAIIIMAAFIVAAGIMKYGGRDLLYKINVKTQYIMPVQVGSLLALTLFFSIVTFGMMETWSQVKENLRGIVVFALRGTPEGTVSHYYTALNQGVADENFWHAYDLWSTHQQAQFNYDQFKATLKGIRCIQVRDLQLVSQTADSAQIFAQVRLIEADTMIKERIEQITYSLTIERGWWRVESIQTRKL